jgi:hypothetical protein
MFVKLGALPGAYDNGMKYSDVLAINHFGSETIPPRPVLRMGAERIAQKFVKERLKAYMTNMIHNPRDAKRLEVVFLQDLGRQAVAEAKRIIENGGELQHNAPATVAKKGYNKPLYETGELEKHLSYEVTNE